MKMKQSVSLDGKMETYFQGRENIHTALMCSALKTVISVDMEEPK